MDGKEAASLLAITFLLVVPAVAACIALTFHKIRARRRRNKRKNKRR